MRRLRAWFLRLAGLLNKQRRERELADELESHLQLHIEDNLRSGMTPVEARRQALIKLGGVEQTKEVYRDRRGIPLVESLIQDVRYSLRMLSKRRGLTLVVVLTLALGIGGTTAIFSVVYGALIDPFPYRDTNRLAVLVTRSTAQNQTEGAGLSPPEWLDYQQQNHVFDEVMGTTVDNVVLTGTATAQRCWAYWVTPNTFRVLGVRPLLGRAFTDEDGKPGAPPVVILSYKTWQSEFGGDPGVVGKMLVLNHRASTVIGVMPARFGKGRGYAAEMLTLWLPVTISRDRVADPYYNYTVPYYTLVGRLKPGVSIEQAASEIGVLAKRFATVYPSDHPKGVTFTIESFTKAFTHGMHPRHAL